MRRCVALLKHIIRHKWFVFLECCRLSIPLLGVLHDLSKLLPDEFIPYAQHFYNSDGSKRQFVREPGYCKLDDMDDESFNVAWLKHQQRNKHHPAWARLDNREEIAAKPYRYVLEMVADWRGAAKAQGGPDITEWYERMRNKMKLHPETREYVEGLIYDSG